MTKHLPEYTNQIFHASSECMAALPDERVSLTVTSPPYWNAIDYDRHAEDDKQPYRTRSYNVGYEDYEQYLHWLGQISREVWRVTRPGGFYALVIGTVLLDGTHYPVPFDVTHRLTRDGWEFRQDIVWNKVTGGVKRAGSFIKRPYPGYFYPNIMTEYILIMRKAGPPLYRSASPAAKEDARLPIGRVFTNDMANSVWHIAPVPPGHLKHPCPFPEEIPWRLIRLYSYPGDLILDPFAGSGQTLKVAHYLDRLYTGYEINLKYVELARQRIAEPPALRPKQLIAHFERLAWDAKATE